MTTEHEASRTLVKSPPELWAECSDAGSLARHLGEFGDITITRLEPETAVAWEGEHASGTVRIEPSGWGTRVTLTARTQPEELSPAVDEVLGAAEPAADETSGAVDPPINETTVDPIAEEDNDATMEETIEEPDPMGTSDGGALRIRWRRVTASMRGLFRSRELAEDQDGCENRKDHEPRAQPPADSVLDADPPPPEAVAETSEVVAPAMMAEPPEAPDAVDAELILTAALDSLGQAHHRPFSRA